MICCDHKIGCIGKSMYFNNKTLGNRNFLYLVIQTYQKSSKCSFSNLVYEQDKISRKPTEGLDGLVCERGASSGRGAKAPDFGF